MRRKAIPWCSTQIRRSTADRGSPGYFVWSVHLCSLPRPGCTVPRRQTRWNGHLALTAFEMFLILPVNLFPRELLAEDYPPVILTQCDPKGHLHLKLVINFVPIHLHHLQTFSLELLNPFADIIPHYPCFSQCFQWFPSFFAPFSKH